MTAPDEGERLGFDYFTGLIKSGSLLFSADAASTSVGGTRYELPDTSFLQYARLIAKRNGIVFACMALRAAIFSEVVFRFARINNGHRTDLFGTNALDILETPWPNGTTGDLANRMISDADLAGNFYAVRRGDRLYRRSPERMMIVLSGDPLQDEFVDIAGYTYYPQGLGTDLQHVYDVRDVVHWTPIPDPEAMYRGMSWITPILREIEADGYATDHKSAFFKNGATPNIAVKLPADVMTKQQFEDFKAAMDASHTGANNAYKTLYLAPGADVEPLSFRLDQLAFNDTQGRDETRIAAAAGVPPVLVGLKEAMQGSSLTAGNYSQARRRFADGTMRPLYRSAAASLQTVIDLPDTGSRLWYDDSQVAFFREDRQDAATIQQTKAATIRNLTDAGFTPKTVVAAVEAEDNSLLEHSGLFSVQLQPPNSGDETDDTNGPADAPKDAKAGAETQSEGKPKAASA